MKFNLACFQALEQKKKLVFFLLWYPYFWPFWPVISVCFDIQPIIRICLYFRPFWPCYRGKALISGGQIVKHGWFDNRSAFYRYITVTVSFEFVSKTTMCIHLCYLLCLGIWNRSPNENKLINVSDHDLVILNLEYTYIYTTLNCDINLCS